MKPIRNYISTLAGGLLAAIFIQFTIAVILFADVPPSNVTFTVKTVNANTNGPSASDKDVFRFVIDKDNASRTNAGLPAWPTDSNAAYRTSYEAFLSQMLQGLHTNYIPLAYSPEVVESKIPKPDKREIDKAVLDLIAGGATVAEILQRLR